MTREEAINVLNDYDINFERHTAKEVAEAHEMAIKALEQESKTDILDKIRAEIKELQLIGYATVDGKREIASRAVMQIIDKYKTESEGKE